MRIHQQSWSYDEKMDPKSWRLYFLVRERLMKWILSTYDWFTSIYIRTNGNKGRENYGEWILEQWFSFRFSFCPILIDIIQRSTNELFSFRIFITEAYFLVRWRMIFRRWGHALSFFLFIRDRRRKKNIFLISSLRKIHQQIYWCNSLRAKRNLNLEMHSETQEKSKSVCWMNNK